MKHIAIRFLAIAGLLGLSLNANAGDWPMWRYSQGRGAASPEALPKQLRLQWQRELPKPRPAWPATQTKLQFDAAYQPVVMGSRMFVGSPVDDSLRAFRTRDGRELWRFYADGPIRFAPVAVNDRVYAVSDDGHLYCVHAETGKLLWKVNGGPKLRPIIGNHRLVSTWPARGGPVYAEGVVYFAASIWPSMGIFVHAVDAETGRKLWTNSETGSRFVVHPHGAPAFGSVVPQGHLVVDGDALIVPGGRSTPAVFDRKTGKLRFFFFDKRTGYHQVSANGGYYFVAGQRYAVKDGASAGSGDPDVLTDELLISSDSGKIIATELQGTARRRLKRDRRGRVKYSLEFSSKTRWTITTQGNSPTNVRAVAGDQIFTAKGRRIARFAIPKAESGKQPVDSKQRPDWSQEIDGEVASVLAADDRLFVVTFDGRLFCFGAEKREAIRHRLNAEKTKPASDATNTAVKQILAGCSLPPRSENKDGNAADPAFCVVLGIGDGQLPAELVDQGNVHAIVIDPSAEKVDGFRRRMSDAGVYGVHLAAHVGDANYPFPPYLASAIICLDRKSAGLDLAEASLQRLFRVLRPYGGTLCLKLSDDEHRTCVTAVRAARLPNARLLRVGEFTLLKRDGSLPKSAGWTHQYADAANSVVSQDDLVKAPLGVLWFGGPSHQRILPRHGHGPNPQVAGGRLIIEGPDILRAVDVYTGRRLWETELPGVGTYYNTTRHFAGAGEIGSNYVTLPDAVYVVYGSRILELDAETGNRRKTFSLKSDENQSPPNWGFASVSGEFLVATSTPVQVAGSTSAKRSRRSQPPKDGRPLVPAAATWKYLAGKDPAKDWTARDFDDSNWKSGKAGFGYGDGDDRTKLNIRGKFTRVYIRKEFTLKADGSQPVGLVRRLSLYVNYDDAFIAYLNGTEIARVNIKQGSGAAVKNVRSHEADGFEEFAIRDFRKLLRSGTNVLAIEGHNVGLTSSDFTLDPVLIAKSATPAAKKPPSKPPSFQPVRYSSASKQLVVFDRKTGKQLWQREAEFNFRHNCIAAADGMLFCIDGLSPAKIQLLKRRGVDAAGKAKLLALDLKTGRKVWSTTDDVFGTFLNYSKEHDVLLQAGSAYRDRASDEVSRGMVAYRGRDGKVLWKDRDLKYGGPCLLWRDKIITNGGGGFQLELKTGKKTGWTYTRMYGCNTAVGCRHMLTFRSGAAGFYDLTGDSGTGNLGGFRSSCTSNLIAADGVLSAPDYTRTCSCAYQNQTSLAFIHMPENEFWTFNRRDFDFESAQRIGINLGAPGDRRSADGTLWFDIPSVGGPSPKVAVETEPQEPRLFGGHSSVIQSGDLKWVAASGAKGIRKLKVTLDKSAKTPAKFTVRLVFAEPEEVKAGERVFAIRLQGKTVAERFDILAAAKGKNRTVVQEFRNITAAGTLEVELRPLSGTKHSPLLCGVELRRLRIEN